MRCGRIAACIAFGISRVELCLIHGVPTDLGGGMSTKVTQGDWSAAVEVFRASLPRPGANGVMTGFFLERWRALRAPFGNGTACGNDSTT